MTREALGRVGRAFVAAGAAFVLLAPRGPDGAAVADAKGAGEVRALLAAGKHEEALAKNPEFLPALQGLGELLVAKGRRDEAIACLRRAAEAVRRDMGAAGFAPMEIAEAEAAAKASLARVEKLDAEVGRAFAAMDEGLVEKALAQAEGYVRAGMRRNALRVLDAAIVLLSGAAELEERRREVAQESNVDVLLPRALDLAPGAERVRASNGRTVQGSKLVADASRAALLLLDAGLGDRYRFEATVEPKRMGDEAGFAAMVVGADAEGAWEVVGTTGEIVETWSVLADWRRVKSVRGLTPEEARSVRIAVEVRPRMLRVSLDGVLVADAEFPAGALCGGVGLLVGDASVEFEDVRLAW